ncbi:hypothetical protein LZ554_000910 [Drepanopeziza brunnea f. sp. 'monogermtubi']|nr:hypothetical protein LZ554_000910 [Drepanopeziza brunnea f. sp. 'monogermtubi']
MHHPYVAESTRLYLQELNEEDHLQTYHALMSNEKSMMWSPRHPTTSVEESRQQLRGRMPTLEKPWNRLWAIMLKNGAEGEEGGGGEAGKGKGGGEGDMSVNPMVHIGNIGIPREAEVGYRIHPDYWRRGYMSEALAMFVALWWADEANQKHPHLLAAADPQNIASTNLLLKHGFQKKGPLRKAFYARASLQEGGQDDQAKKSDLQNEGMSGWMNEMSWDVGVYGCIYKRYIERYVGNRESFEGE